MHKKNQVFRSVWLLVFVAIIFSAYNENLILDAALIPRFIAGFGFMLSVGIYILLRKSDMFRHLLSRPGPMLAGLGLYLVSGGISLIYTRILSEGLFDWFKMFFLVCVVIFIVSLYLNNENFIDDFSLPVNLFSIAACIPGLITFAGLVYHNHLNLPETYTIVSVFTNRNVYSEVLLISLPFALYGVVAYKGLRFYLGLAASSLSILMISVMMSREVMVAGLAGFVVASLFFIIINFRKFGQAVSAHRNIFRLSFFIIIPVSVFFIYKINGNTNLIRTQTSFISEPNEGSAGVRLDLWKRSMELIKKHPAEGVGLGAWKIEQMQFSVKGTVAEDTVTTFQSPHNDFIWVLSELGIPGLIFYLLVFLSGYYYLFSIIKKMKGKQESIFFYLIVFGLTAYFVISCFGFPRDRIEEQALAGILLSAIVIGYHKYAKSEESRNSQPTKPVISRLSLLLMLLLMSSACLLGILRFRSELHLRNAYEARDCEDQPRVISEINKAESPVFRVDPYNVPLRWYSGNAYALSGKNTYAHAEFTRAYIINPYQVHVINDLASTEFLMQHYPEAIDLYKKALQINPSFQEAALNLSTAYFQVGDTGSAYICFRKIDALKPDSRYQEVEDVIVPAAISFVTKSIAEAEIRHYLLTHAAQQGWCRQIHYSAVRKNISLQYACILNFIQFKGSDQNDIAGYDFEKIELKYRHAVL